MSSSTTMTRTTNEPTKPTERSGGGWMILGTLVCLMGVTGLLAVTMGSSFCGGMDSSLRGSSTTCPIQVPFLNLHGVVEGADNLASSVSYQPSCVSAADPQDGTYVDFVAPTPGRVTLAAWSVWVDPVTCACMTGTASTQTVAAGQTLRLWMPRSSDSVVHFVSDHCPAEEDDDVLILDDGGRVDMQEEDKIVLTTMTHNAPSCVSATDPQVGRYYDWIAPADGVVTLAASTILIEDPKTCACVDATVAQQTVMTGQRLRVWTSALEEDQPLQFLGKINP